MKAGIYTNNQLSNEDYHSSDAIGSSGIKEFLECPALYHAKYISKTAESKYSNATSIGTHAHLTLLEPEKFEDEYLIAPKTYISNKGKKNEQEKPLDKKTVTGWKEFCTEASEMRKTPLLHKEFEQITAMAAAVKAHNLANVMLTKGRAEMSFFAKDPETGLMLKSRPDYLVKMDGIGNVLVDYKTTGLDLSESAQSRNAFSLGRQIQAAHHKRVTELATGGEIAEVLYVTQMQSAPYLVRVFRMPHDALQVGQDQVSQALIGLAHCQEDGIYPDYPHEIEDLVMPRWMD